MEIACERLYLNRGECEIRAVAFLLSGQNADLTEEDKQNFEDLREILREVGLGLNITISANMDSFMSQAEELNNKIESPLN